MGESKPTAGHDNGEPSYLFVVGCTRSGTSWLSSMLRSHPKVGGPNRESQVYRIVYGPFVTAAHASLWRRLRHGRAFVRDNDWVSLLRRPEQDVVWEWVWERYSAWSQAAKTGLHHWIGSEEFRSLLDEYKASPGRGTFKAREMIKQIFQAHARENMARGQTVLLEKSPLHAYYVDVILEDHPRSRVVEIVRDGRDVCVSHHARAKGPGGRFAEGHTARIILKWKRCINSVERARSAEENAGRIHRVHFEELRQNPEVALRAIFDFAGISASADLVLSIVDACAISRVVNKGEGHHVRSGLSGEWRSRLSIQDRALCELLAGRTLRRLGYARGATRRTS